MPWIADAVIKKLAIPEVKSTIDVPVIGGIDVDVNSINITTLVIPPETTKIAIESGYYHLQASNLTARVRLMDTVLVMLHGNLAALTGGDWQLTVVSYKAPVLLIC